MDKLKKKIIKISIKQWYIILITVAAFMAITGGVPVGLRYPPIHQDTASSDEIYVVYDNSNYKVFSVVNVVIASMLLMANILLLVNKKNKTEHKVRKFVLILLLTLMIPFLFEVHHGIVGLIGDSIYTRYSLICTTVVNGFPFILPPFWFQ